MWQVTYSWIKYDSHSIWVAGGIGWSEQPGVLSDLSSINGDDDVALEKSSLY